MPRPPVTTPDPADDSSESMQRIADLERRLDALTAAAGSSSKTPLLDHSKLRDTRILYKHPTLKPRHGAVLVWDTELEPKLYKGKLRPRGGAYIETIETVTDTGDLIWEGALADSALWPETTQWDVSITVTVGGTFSAPAADDVTVTIPEGTTITVPAGTTATGVEIDGDPGVTVVFSNAFTFDVPTGGEIQFDHPADAWGIAKPLPTGLVRLIPEGGLSPEHPEPAFLPLGINNTGQLAGTTGWLYAGGTPYAQVAIDIDSTDYPGDHTLNVIARAWPTPTLGQPAP